MDPITEAELQGRTVWDTYNPRVRGWSSRLTTPQDDFEPVAMEGWDLI